MGRPVASSTLYLTTLYFVFDTRGRVSPVTATATFPAEREALGLVEESNLAGVFAEDFEISA
ncbi:hypothetical protein XF_0990 [Xylella fastidiosa 9a5c]|uniref:Uncharacterized protein n=1 Tax=Xylella fastidiosa (strain 9a5c) TaxID=160492 RepID=Q9PEN8_XYLFA|nr:hypothetical protein XF_0990 [Xylella fastidiosa 9a5c]